MGVPKYCCHKGRNKGYVRCTRILGSDKQHYFPGAYNSIESRAAYQRWILEHCVSPEPEAVLYVSDLLATYRTYAEQHYKSNGDTRCAEPYHLKGVFRSTLRATLKGASVGAMPVDKFGPLALIAVRDYMVEHHDWTRRYINEQIGRLKRIWRWGVSQEIVLATVYQALQTVEGLRKGKSKARESKPVRPVEWELVEAALPYLPLTLSTAVKLQWLTGMRSSNLVKLRLCEIDRTGDVWIYEPAEHKGSHLGLLLRVPLGPRCQEVLSPLLERPQDAYIFSPREAQQQRYRMRGQNCRSSFPKIGERYKTDSYRRAVWYALDKLNRANGTTIHWHPHQLRHSRATQIKAQHGSEAATAFMGHAELRVTEIYAERNLGLAIDVARKMG